MPATKRADQIKSLIKSELIRLLKEDDSCRQSLVEITAGKYAEKAKTEDRFDRILDELKADRERQDKKWEENQAQWNARWEENQAQSNARWEENQAQWNARWEESQAQWNARWEESQAQWNARWEENDKKWEENQKVINEMLAAIKGLDKKIEGSLGALGARWGLQSEASFRNGLKAILEESFKVKVERYQDFDEQGFVFGKPDQVELDVIIYNDSLILCEIKSSMSKSDTYAFWRKKEFYEQRHNRKADRFIVISPMVDPLAQKVAQELGLEVYSFAEDVSFEARETPQIR